MGMTGERGLVARLRAGGGPSMRLLELLYTHRVMTTQQAARATGTPERTVLYRLDRLREAGLVDRIRPGRETGSAPQHWFLRRAGAQLVTASVPVDPRAPSGMFMAHAAAITEVWLALVEHGPGQGMVVSRWLTDRAAWQQWPQPGSTWGPAQENRLTPDALVGVRLHAEIPRQAINGEASSGDVPNPGDVAVPAEPAMGPLLGEVGAFLEVDLATMTQTQLKVKLKRYRAYARDRAWAGWAGACPPMLLLTTSEARAATFIRAVTRDLKAERGTYSSWRRNADDEVIAAAEQLVVVAAGFVRDPAMAVTEPVWLLNNETFTPVMLREVLAVRHVVGTRAVVIRRYRAEVEQRQHITWQLGIALHQARRGLLDKEADEWLKWQARPGHVGPDRLLDTDPELAELILTWHRNRHDNAARQALIRLLRGRHRTVWIEQASRLLAATDHHQARSRSFVTAVLALDDGDLLDTWTDEALTRPVPERDNREHPQWAAYQQARADHVEDEWGRLSLTRRWRTSRDAISDAYDQERLRVCGRCAALIPTVAPHYDATCDRCDHQHDLRPLTDRAEITAALHTRLDHIAALLAHTTRPPANPADGTDEAE